MSILNIQYLAPGRSASSTLNGRKEVRTHSRRARVTCSSIYDTAWEVLAALPKVGTVHPNDSNAFVSDKRVESHDKARRVFIVNITYSTERPRDSNPANDPVDIVWDTDTQVEPILYDINGRPMLNSAGDAYGEAIKGEVSYWTVTCTKNELYIPTWILDYANAVNSDAFLLDGIMQQEGMCKIKKIHIDRLQTREEYQYRPVQIVLKVCPKITIHTIDTGTGDHVDLEVSRWDANVIDEGIKRWRDTVVPDSPVHVPCIGGDKRPATKAMALDGNGYQLGVDSDSWDDAETYTPPSAEDIIWNNFERYPKLPFSVLPLSN